MKYYYPFEDLIVELLISQSDLSNGMRCIDLGCGNSPLFEKLLHFGCKVYRVDIDTTILYNIGEQFVANTNLINIEEDIVNLSNLNIGVFDRVYFSLASCYNDIEKLNKIWEVISKLSKPSTLVFSIDIHPFSKYSNFSWRKNIKELNCSYWDEIIIDVELTDSKFVTVPFSYFYFTLENLFGIPIQNNFKLLSTKEFPKVYSGQSYKIPAYLYSKWEKCYSTF
jgi:SAM-dependent methyltransferase